MSRSIELVKIYTRKGDSGESSVLGDKRLRKDNPVFEALGTIDELNSVLGLARFHVSDSEMQKKLVVIQNTLFALGTILASPQDDRFKYVSLDFSSAVSDLEKEIDRVESRLPRLTKFILPGGGIAGSWLHHARTICRRAERRVATLSPTGDAIQGVLKYLNRLSDLLFVYARFANYLQGIPDTEVNI